MASDWATGRSRPIACWQAASKTRREPHRPRLDRPMSAREDCVERTERSCGSGRAGADAPARQQARGFPVAVSDSVARRASTGASGLKPRIESPAVRASPTGIHPRPSTAGPPDRPRQCCASCARSASAGLRSLRSTDAAPKCSCQAAFGRLAGTRAIFWLTADERRANSSS